MEIQELATLLDPAERSLGACSVARSGGATHLCIFIRDPELEKFLPGPGFPQKLPGGMEWMRYIRGIAQSGTASARLPSPFSSTETAVCGFRLTDNAIAVLFGEETQRDAATTLAPGLRIIASLLVQEVQTARARTRALLSYELAQESRQLAKSLSEAHDQLAASFDARESLSLEILKRDRRLHLARSISGIGVWEFSPSTGKIYLAPETAAIYALPAGEYFGSVELVRSRIHPDDRSRVLLEAERAVAAGQELNLQFRIVWPNGIVRWVEERGMPFEADSQGGTPAVSGFTLDITQRVMTESALVRSEKLAAAGRLAASIAHEINNPLEGLVNIVYLARSEENLDRMRELLKMADEELARVSSVARTALGFYREGTASVAFDISQLVQQVLDLFQKQIAKAGVQISTEFAAGTADLQGWPGEIKQAVSNLLINALHACPASAAIRIRVKRVRNEIQLVVADSGHGIGSAHMTHIFEPFYSTKKDSGTGLGLWVTKQIVEKHGGSIRVRSSTRFERPGTVFLLSFPVAGNMPFEKPDQSLRYRWMSIGA